MINGNALHQYIELESAINDFEKKHVLENYQIRTEQLEQLERTTQKLNNDLMISQRDT